MDINERCSLQIEIPVAPPPPKARVKPTPQPKPEIVEPIKLNPRQPHIFVTQKVVQPKTKAICQPDLDTCSRSFLIYNTSNQPARPARRG